MIIKGVHVKAKIVRDFHIYANGLLPSPYDEPRGIPREEPAEKEICAAVEWLRMFCTPTKTIRSENSSYRLKHKAEHWAGTYISNGALIVACLREGYGIERIGGTVNANFNISLSVKKKLRREELKAQTSR